MFISAQNKADFKIIETLAHTIWTEHYIPIVGKQQVEFMLDKFQSIDAISRQIADEGYLYYIIRDSDMDIGYIAVQPRKHELFLSKIYIQSSQRGNGYGKKSVIFIEEIAKKHNLNKILLTVNKNNSNSIKAYKKIGFKCIDKTVTDIGNGFVMDDFIMARTL